MFKCISDLKYDWLRLNGVNVFVCCLGMYARGLSGKYRAYLYIPAP